MIKRDRTISATVPSNMFSMSHRCNEEEKEWEEVEKEEGNNRGGHLVLC